MSSDHNKETILLEKKYFLASVLDLFSTGYISGFTNMVSDEGEYIGKPR